MTVRADAEPERFALIASMKPDGTDLQTFARGVRNSVGFDWHPGTRELWFTDNGRDLMGDDLPPDELNHAPLAGLHFGYPYCHGGTIADPEFGGERSCNEFVPPAQNLGPHVAALGMAAETAMLRKAKRGCGNRAARLKAPLGPPGRAAGVHHVKRALSSQLEV